jgi:hypothetical protein
VAVVSVDAIPIDVNNLLTGTIEPGLFIKRVFYSDLQTGRGDVVILLTRLARDWTAFGIASLYWSA